MIDKYTQLLGAGLLLAFLMGGCAPESEPEAPPTVVLLGYCPHVWQTGYDAVGQLVIGHPMVECDSETDGEVGILEAPLPEEPV